MTASSRENLLLVVLFLIFARLGYEECDIGEQDQQCYIGKLINPKSPLQFHTVQIGYELMQQTSFGTKWLVDDSYYFILHGIPEINFAFTFGCNGDVSCEISPK